MSLPDSKKIQHAADLLSLVTPDSICVVLRFYNGSTDLWLLRALGLCDRWPILAEEAKPIYAALQDELRSRGFVDEHDTETHYMNDVRILLELRDPALAEDFVDAYRLHFS